LSGNITITYYALSVDVPHYSFSALHRSILMMSLNIEPHMESMRMAQYPIQMKM